MKIKIAFFGLCLVNSLMQHPIYADQDDFYLDTDEIDVESMVEKKDVLPAKKDEAKAGHLIKLGTTITMGPSLAYQDQVFSSNNCFAAHLTFKANLPEAWCNQEATVDIDTGWEGKSFTINNAAVMIGKMVTMGYAATIFGYTKVDPALLISTDATMLQIKHEHTWDWFRIGYAIERPLALQLGRFDKDVPKKEIDEKKVNKLDDLKDKKRSFKVNNSFPALGISLGIIKDHFHMGLSGLGRYTDYTHSIDPDEEKLPRKYCLTYGGNLGVQYQVVPEKFTATGQGIYVHGLGEYLSGLSAIQNDEARSEMCAAYYIDKDKDACSFIDAWGFGATLECCATPKWKLSIRGSYLTTFEDAQKPSYAFRAQWNVVPKVTYAFNKYFTLFGGYSLVKEFTIDEQEEKGLAHKLSGGIKFSL